LNFTFPMRRFSKLTFSLCFTVVSLFFNTYLSLASNNDGAKTEDCLITAEEFNTNPLPSAAINFVGGSLFVGAGRNSLWLRAAINEPGNVYVAIYTTDPGAMTGAQIRTAAITAGVQNSPVNGAVEVAGTTPVGTFSQQQQFTAASVPSFPSFPGTPYAGTRYTGLTFGTTYFYRIVARDAGGTNFSPIISGSIATAADVCGATSPGSNQFGSDAKLCGPRNVQFNMSLTGIAYGDPY